MVGDDALEFSVLGSGSAGNCVLVSNGETSVLIDAGLSAKSTQERLLELGLSGRRVHAVLLTHEHGDHVSHASRVARHFGCPLFANRKTREAAAKIWKGNEEFVEFTSGSRVTLGRLEIATLKKPHDAADAVAYLVSDGKATVGVFTDLGHVDGAVGEAISQCSAIVMESNHDPEMLANGPYPAMLKARVGGRFGHISNDDAAQALSRYRSERLKTVVLAHLSTTNNSPALVKAASIRHLGREPGFVRRLSLQDRPTVLQRADGVLSAAVGSGSHRAAAAEHPREVGT